MNHNDERDYAEEAANRRLIEQADDSNSGPGWPLTVDQRTIDERREQIAGLRQMIDWLEAHPAVPLESTLRRYALYPEHWVEKGNTAAALDELRRISATIGVGINPTGRSRHVYVSVPPFRGGVEVQLIVCDAAHLLVEHRHDPACPHGYDAEDACERCTPPSVLHVEEPAEPQDPIYHCSGGSLVDGEGCEDCAGGWCGVISGHCHHRTPTYDERDELHDPAEDHCVHCGCCTCNSCAYARMG